MKLTSVSDVITNSSTEVFLILNSKGVDEKVFRAALPFPEECITRFDLNGYRQFPDNGKFILEKDLSYFLIDSKIKNEVYYSLFYYYLRTPKVTENPEEIIRNGRVEIRYRLLDPIPQRILDLRKDLQRYTIKVYSEDIKSLEDNKKTENSWWPKHLRNLRDKALQEKPEDFIKHASYFTKSFKQWVDKNSKEFPSISELIQMYNPELMPIEACDGCLCGEYSDERWIPSSINKIFDDLGLSYKSWNL